LSIVSGNPGNAGNVRIFIDGSIRSQTILRTAVIGFGIYQPGWRWSLHAGPQTGKGSENHIGYVVSGRMMIKDASGKEAEIEPGCAFETGHDHDAWVVGDVPCIALDFMPISD
jgi:hypothetical protein